MMGEHIQEKIYTPLKADKMSLHITHKNIAYIMVFEQTQIVQMFY